MNHYDNLPLAQLRRTPRPGAAVSNEIDPTQQEWMEVLQMLRDGKTDREIRMAFVRTEGEAQKGLSPRQVRMARARWVAALAAREAEQGG